jgi:hypothetical protein
MKPANPSLLVVAAIPLATLGLAAVALHREPAFFLQPNAQRYVSEAAIPLVLYAAIAVIVAFRRSPHPHALRFATLAGLALSVPDILSLCIENGIPFSVSSPALQISVMLLLFLGWGYVAYHLAASGLGRLASIASAVWATFLNVTVAVAAGVLLELFLHPPPPAYVGTWAEYTRSGWTSPRAFAVANTFDSVFSHLLLSPIVALVFGSLGAAIGSAVARRRMSPCFPTSTDE